MIDKHQQLSKQTLAQMAEYNRRHERIMSQMQKQIIEIMNRPPPKAKLCEIM